MIEKVLEERASRYGTFANHAEISQGLQEVLWDSPNWHKIPLDTRQAFIVICDKMARALNGDPEYDDNLVDIIGYATLVLDRIRKKMREREEAKEKEAFILHLGEKELFDPPNYDLADE